jgi:hypothetical protein
MRDLKKILLGGFLLMVSQMAWAQKPDSTAKEEEEDYSSYGSAEESSRFCTQKVRFLSPTKLISVGYEAQFPFKISFLTEEEFKDKENLPERNQTVEFFGGARWAANAPVISNNKFILNLGASYYESYMRFKDNEIINNTYERSLKSALSRGLRTMGLNATAFKPLDEKHFVIGSLIADFNGNFGWSTLIEAFPKPTWTFAALYGWKRNDNTMIAIGATQTWRGGELLYVPLILFNKTFNDKWGLEILAPARAHVRYNFSASSLLMLGYEIEGNSYRLFRGQENFEFGTSGGRFLEVRRSEIKPRIIFEQKLAGFIWLSAQVGYRYNFKFGITEDRASDRGDFIYKGNFGNPLYAGISINLVSP